MRWPAQTARDKLATLAEAYGYESVMELLEAYAFDDIVPAICMNGPCDAVADMEPDATFGWCEECRSGSMSSALVLAGII